MYTLTRYTVMYICILNHIKYYQFITHIHCNHKCICSVPVSLGMRDQALDWQTAPPVHVLSFLILGSEKDAKSEEVSKFTLSIIVLLC